MPDSCQVFYLDQYAPYTTPLISGLIVIAVGHSDSRPHHNHSELGVSVLIDTGEFLFPPNIYSISYGVANVKSFLYFIEENYPLPSEQPVSPCEDP